MDSLLFVKAKPLGKEEVMVLLDLISKYEVITNRATDAKNNKLKEDAWAVITQQFNEMVGEFRRPEQLRLKWENLKKSARKRNATIKQNTLKGDANIDIRQDEVLDRVTAILQATSDDYRAAAEIQSTTDFQPSRLVKFGVNKRKRLLEETYKARRDKDLAIAAYFQAKTEKIKLESIKLKIQIEKLQETKTD